MKMVPADSTNIAAIGYDAETKRMAVQFKNGGLYHYEDVPKEAHTAFVSAPSIGKHFHAHIRNAFKSTKVETEAA